MIKASTYFASWKLQKNKFTFKIRSSETGKIIWPFQMMYVGINKMIYTDGRPSIDYRLTPDEYLMLKLKDRIL